MGEESEDFRLLDDLVRRGHVAPDVAEDHKQSVRDDEPRRRFNREVKELEERAEDGDVEAMMILAFSRFDLHPSLYSFLRTDRCATSPEWLERAAALDHVPAMLGLGRLYTRTLGSFLEDEDKVKIGLDWYKKAAGEPYFCVDALVALGDLSTNREGGTLHIHDLDGAREWWLKAADLIDSDTPSDWSLNLASNLYTRLGMLYEQEALDGAIYGSDKWGNLKYRRLSRQELQPASFWYEKAAACGSEYASAQLKEINGGFFSRFFK
jgi:TPR repeat protein